MLTALLTFFNQISDIRFGGTYITLLGTFRSIGWAIPNSSIMFMASALTIHKCTNYKNSTCSTSESIHVRQLNY